MVSCVRLRVQLFQSYIWQASRSPSKSTQPKAELHLLPDGGHWLLETHLDEVARLMRDFLWRTLA